jgi:hypothetical protein
MATRITVKKSDPPESKEVLATAITKISDGFDAMLKSGLNKKAIIILIQAETKLPQRDIRLVLDALPRLKGWYCR